ncbi:hypothetical protein ACM66B_006662 [Microbotryomycetes sp. NB124-2]
MTRSQRIPMTSIKALTLQNDKLTTARRSSPVPQLTCQGKLCKQYQPDVVQCQAVGEDGHGGLEWACRAELPRGMRFGSVEVGCEGWDGPDDPYVLKGSCGLTYKLVKTPSALDDGGVYSKPWRDEQPLHPLVSLALFLASAWAVYRALGWLFARRRNIQRFFMSGPSGGPGPGGGGGWGWPGGWGGSGGPGFGGGQGGPPPPYTPKATGQPEQGGWRPGFWSGALAGAFATEAASRYRSRGANRYDAYGRGATRGSSWSRDDDDRGVGGSGSWGRPSGPSSSSRSEMRESTGFGGTRNR